MKNFLLGIFITIIIMAIGVGAYFYGKRSTKNTITPEPYPINTREPATPTPEVELNNNELIKKALFNKHGWTDADGITVTVSTNDGKYASGGVSSGVGGGYFYATKVDGVWQIVADGNGVITCESLTNYPDFPKILIPECYDSTTSKTVKR